MKRLGLLVTVLILGAAVAACDDNNNGSVTSPSNPQSTTSTFSLALTTANEVPPITNAESAMSGTATIVLHVTRDSGGTITGATADFQVSANGLLSTTTLTAAHIHRAAAGVNGGVVVNTGLSPTTASSFSATGINVAADVAQAILASPRDFYFNVHTTLNPGGAIRAQLGN